MSQLILPPYQAEVYRIKPAGFSSKLDVAACYIQVGNHYLFLHRAKDSFQPFTWGLPAGKFEAGETPHQAVVREVREEIGISLKQEELRYIAPLYVRYPHLDFTYHAFLHKCVERPRVQLSHEHTDYRWLKPEEVLSLPLISGGKETLHHILALAECPLLQPKDFYFIRHGETEVNAEASVKRVDYDLPLNNRGVQQAIAARQVVARLPLDKIRCSPIQRATQTRDIILSDLSLPHSEDDCLSECKAETWTKMVQLEQGSGYEACSSVQSFLSRTGRGLKAALEEEGTPLLVAHGGIHWVICYYLGVEDHPWKIGNCQVVYFQPTLTGGWKASVII